jgi:hypothetical protein
MRDVIAIIQENEALVDGIHHKLRGKAVRVFRMPTYGRVEGVEVTLRT